LKFPNGQFPLKTPGPISPTTLEQKKQKQFLHVVGYFFERAKKLKISNFVCQVGVSSLEIS
jgi:hypothetical protein